MEEKVVNQEELKKMEELVETLNKYAYYYYVLDNPLVSDYDYDKLYDQLIALEKKLGVVLPNSPSIRVGGDVLPHFKKYPHKTRLYSLDKCQSLDELSAWVDSVKKFEKDVKFNLSYKYDGLTIVCHYKNGLFVSAGTRGNGSVGEDVTEQVKTIRSVPLKINFKGELIVQGEGIITLSNLAEYNKNNPTELKNARNAAAGAIKNLDPKETAKRKLDWVCYSITYIEGRSFETQSDAIEFLKQNGFKTTELFEVVDSFEQMKKIIKSVDEKRSKLDFLIDGVVVNIDQMLYREELGYTSKFPKWAIAFKFDPEEATSILTGVVWQVGRTGKITPIGIVEPVELAGATVRRATLNNIEDIQKKGLKIGARVFIRRSNEVIPEILSVAEVFENSKPIDEPEYCPCCNFKLVKKNMLSFCPNKNGCKDQIIERLVHFVSKEAMNMVGLSEQTLKLFYEKFNVKNPSDLFDLKEEDLKNLEGFKDKKANNIIESIQKAKEVRLSNFIYALGILGVGNKTSKDLAKYFEDFESFSKASYEELLKVKDIGTTTASDIVDYFKNKDNLDEINRLWQKGVKIIQSQTTKKKNTFFEGKKVVLTGKLEAYSREEMTELLEQHGAIVSSSVSKNTDYVIVGENAGSKLDKAKELKIKTLTEKEALNLLMK